MKSALSPLFVAGLLIASGCLGEKNAGTPQDQGTLKAPIGNLTNVIFLGAAPETTLVAPNGTTPTAIPLTTSGVFVDQGTNWEYTLKNDATISGGKLIVFVHVVEPTLHPGFLVGGSGTCTWRMDAFHDGQPLFGGPQQPPLPCLAANPGPLSGDLKVEFDFTFGTKVKAKADETLTFQFLSFTSSNPARPTLEIYTGASTFDSKVTLKGLNETLPM